MKQAGCLMVSRLILSLSSDVAAPEIDVGRREIVEALVVAAMVVVIDRGRDLLLEINWEEVVFEQDAVLQRRCQRSILPWAWGCQGAPRV